MKPSRILDTIRYIRVEDLKRYSLPVNLVLIGIFAWILASIINTYISTKIGQVALPTEPLEKFALPPISRADLDLVFKRNIFNPEGTIPDEEAAPTLPTGEIDYAAAVPTALNVTLIGTIVLTDPKLSVAAIAADGEVNSYRVDGQFAGVATILKIIRKKVYFRNESTSRLEFVEIQDFGPTIGRAGLAGPPPSAAEGIRESAEGQYEVSRAFITNILEPDNLSEILKQANSAPVRENGVMVGYRVFSIKPGSIYDQMGLKNGDIITTVNGAPLDSPAKALELFTLLRNESSFSVDVRRHGGTQSFSYNIR